MGRCGCQPEVTVSPLAKYLRREAKATLIDQTTSFPETKWGLFLLETQKDTDAKNGNVSCTKLSGSRGASLYPQVIA